MKYKTRLLVPIITLSSVVFFSRCQCVERAPTGGDNQAGESCQLTFDCAGDLICRDGVCTQNNSDAGPADSAASDSPLGDGAPRLDVGTNADTATNDHGMFHDAGSSDSRVTDTVVLGDANSPDTAQDATHPQDATQPQDATAPLDAAPVTDTMTPHDAAALFDAATADTTAGVDSYTPPTYCQFLSRHTLDFGPTQVNCSSQKSFAVVNACPESRMIYALTIDGSSDFSLGITLPVSVAAGETLLVPVSFSPSTAGASGADLTASLEVSAAVQQIHLSGTGVEGQDHFETFVQGGADDVDFLIVIDDSGSMYDIQTQLVADLQTLLPALGQADYHIAATTTDMSHYGPQGKFVPVNVPDPVITPMSLPSPEQRIQQAVSAGINGSGTERGIDAAAMALSPSMLTNQNSGFLRTHAKLALLFVSDEDDSSTTTPQQLVEQLRGLKAGQGDNAISVGAIVGPPPSGCTRDGSEADPGTAYLETVWLASGSHTSVCDNDWTGFLMRMAFVGSGNRQEFFLQQTAATISSVAIDGVALEASSYIYDPEGPSVTLAEYPDPGQMIQIDYTLLCQ